VFEIEVFAQNPGRFDPRTGALLPEALGPVLSSEGFVDSVFLKANAFTFENLTRVLVGIWPKQPVFTFPFAGQGQGGMSHMVVPYRLQRDPTGDWLYVMDPMKGYATAFPLKYFRDNIASLDSVFSA